MIVNFKINKGDKLRIEVENQFGEVFEKHVTVVAIEIRESMNIAMLDDGTAIRFLEDSN